MRAKIIIFSIITVAFGAGLVWTAKNGIRLAVNHIQEQTERGPAREIITAKTVSNEEKKGTQQASMLSAIFPDNYVSIIVGGDVMMDRGIRLIGDKYGYDSLFAAITPLFKSADIVAVNLEGTITSLPSKTLLSDKTSTDSLTFTFAPETAKALVRAGVTLVSLANNHSDNFGLKGLSETKRYLQNEGVQWFGDPWNASPSEAIVCKKDACFAFVGYNAFQPGFPGIVARVKQLSERGNFVIVLPHWGEEYSSPASDKMKEQARELAAAGASAIIGSHSHVIAEQEWIGAVPVYYSVGNLLFDQYFSPQTMKGELVKLRIAAENGKPRLDNLEITEISTASRRGITVLKD
jgi:poly-gamma-glutamate synthesis protein (capsule biosynthesis protein)